MRLTSHSRTRKQARRRSDTRRMAARWASVRAARLAAGEDLVLYRDIGGRVGLIDRHCPHRRADLSYGREGHPLQACGSSLLPLACDILE